MLFFLKKSHKKCYILMFFALKSKFLTAYHYVSQKKTLSLRVI